MPFLSRLGSAIIELFVTDYMNYFGIVYHFKLEYSDENVFEIIIC